MTHSIPPTATAIVLHDTPAPSGPLLSLLQSRLPYSLPVLRRLQFARNFPGGSSPHTHVLHACYGRDVDVDADADADQGQVRGQGHSNGQSHGQGPEWQVKKTRGEGEGEGEGEQGRDTGRDYGRVGGKKEGQQDEEKKHRKKRAPFAAAYVDLSRGYETHVWIYSTLEDGRGRVGRGAEDDGPQERRAGGEGTQPKEQKEEEEALDLVMAVLRRIRAIAGEDVASSSAEERTGSRENKRPAVMVGSLHEAVRQGLLARGVRMEKTLNVPADLEWELCGKWLFRVDDLPLGGRNADDASSGIPLPQGMRWDRVQREDIKLVQSRTSIARREATLLMLPNTVVRRHDGTPVAWAFMGLDGTLMTLHVEEPYRRLGLARAVACKLMCEHLRDYGDDGWGAADVFVLNHKSQALCKSIGGRLSWTLSWAMLDLSSIGEPMCQLGRTAISA